MNRFDSDRLTMTQGQCLTAVRLTKCPDIGLAGESGVLKNFRGCPLHGKLGASRTLVFIVQNIPDQKTKQNKNLQVRIFFFLNGV